MIIHTESRTASPPPAEPRLPQLLADWQAGKPVSIDDLGRLAIATWNALCLRIAEDDAILHENETVWRAGIEIAGEAQREREKVDQGFAMEVTRSCHSLRSGFPRQHSLQTGTSTAIVPACAAGARMRRHVHLHTPPHH